MTLDASAILHIFYNVYVQTVDKIRLEVTSYNDGQGTTVKSSRGQRVI